MAAPTCVLTTVKDMTYRGLPGEEWSNTYAFSGATPADSTAWRALWDAVAALEKVLFTSYNRVVAGYGYNKIPEKGDHAIWTFDARPGGLTVAGTLTLTGSSPMAGDQAGWVRWSLDRYNTYGKRVYLRKYFHGGIVDQFNPDALPSSYKTALAQFGTKMMDGTVVGSRKLVDKDGNLPIASAASQYATTRTLKRRGKRPPRVAA